MTRTQLRAAKKKETAHRKLQQRRAEKQKAKKEALARLKNAAEIIRPRLANLDAMRINTIEQDIEYCREEARVGDWYADVQADCEIAGVSPKWWLKDNGFGDDTKFKDRLRLSRNWPWYEPARRSAIGDDDHGRHGVAYALWLIRRAQRREKIQAAAGWQNKHDPSGCLDISRADLRVGDALSILDELPNDIFQCIVTSPPHLGGHRDYGHKRQIGWEKSVDAYIRKLVAIFRKARKKLKPDGLLWIIIGDTYGRPAGRWSKASGRATRATVPLGLTYPALGTPKELIGVPWLLALALKADGWCLRQMSIWSKTAIRPGSVGSRTSTAHDYILMLSRQPDHYFNAAAIADESSSGERRPGTPTREGQPTRERLLDFLRNWGDGETRNSRSVWQGPAQRYRGKHPATFPPWIAAKCILASCPPNQECQILDPFSGAGTTAMVALQLGHRATGIELNPEYVQESCERIAAAPSQFKFPHEVGVRAHHHRLRNAVTRAVTWEDRFHRLAADPSKLPEVQREIELEEMGAPPLEVSPLARAVIGHERVGNSDLYFGDSFEAMARVEPESLDMIFADLPFGMTRLAWDIRVNLRQFLLHSLRLLKPTGVIVACGSWPFTIDLANAGRELLRFHWIWWNDRPPVNHHHTAQHPLNVSQEVLIFAPMGEGFTFNPQCIPLAKPKHRSFSLASSFYRSSNGRIYSPVQTNWGRPTNHLFFHATPEDRKKPTQKPLEMVRYFVDSYCPQQGRLGEFFCGTAPASVVAIQTGRTFVAADSDSDQFQFALDRLQRAQEEREKTTSKAAE